MFKNWYKSLYGDCIIFIYSYSDSIFYTFLPFTDTSWYTMLACAIFIVPGVPMVNALEDMLDCYITAGITRAMNTLLMVGSMTLV